MILGELVCERCRLRFSRQAKTCPGCNQPRVLAFFDDRDARHALAAPGTALSTRAKRAGARTASSGPLAICTLEERATTLLADDTGRVHPQLQPLYDVLLGARRPQTVLYWFNRLQGPKILKAMAEARSTSRTRRSSSCRRTRRSTT